MRRSPRAWRAQTGAGLGLLVLGLGVCWQAAQLTLGAPSRPGPGFYPLVLGALLALLAVWVMVEARASPAQFEPVPDRPASIATVALIPALLVAFALLIEPLGYLPSTFLLVGLLLRLAGRGWLGAASIALGTTLFSFVLFSAWLGVPLPGGLLDQFL